MDSCVETVEVPGLAMLEAVEVKQPVLQYVMLHYICDNITI